ncbi:MAG: TetR/AcrR family transcriptional regulator [Myxococcota bacterium]
MGKAQRRDELLDAARRVFAEKGFHEAKVEDIAQAAGVAKGTLYLYFPDKRSVFSELIDHLFLRLSGAILRVDTDGDVRNQVKHNIRAVLGVLLDDPDSMRILFNHAGGVDRSFSEKIEGFYDGLKQMLAESLEEGQGLAIVAEGDPRLYAAFTLGALKELLTEVARADDRPRTREALVESVYQLLQSGYLRG